MRNETTTQAPKIGEGWEIHSHAPYSIWKGDKQIASFLWTLEDGSESPVCEEASVAAENARLALRAVSCHDTLATAAHAYIEWIRKDSWAHGSDTHQAWSEAEEARKQFHLLMNAAASNLVAAEGA